jgi:cyclophilin family peptidyl-prolyl cis-trans isomerase/HEAT repeat protein
MTFIARVTLRPPLRIAPLILSSLLVMAADRELLAQKRSVPRRSPVSSVPRETLLRIVRAEDERRWDADLRGLLSDRSAAVRTRAALAAGRIGDERGVASLVALLEQDKHEGVRAMAAFALGETESASAVDALSAELAKRAPARVRARILEGLGKVTAALPAADETRVKSFREEIYAALEFENARRSAPETQLILLGLTAALRARPEGAGKLIAEFLTYDDARIRAGASNALARMRSRDGNEQLRKLLINDPAPIVRANAARVLGATEDKEAFDGLLDRALKDIDLRVRVSAIRSLAALKDKRAADAFRTRITTLLALNPSSPGGQGNEILEVAVMLGRVLQGEANKEGLAWLARMRERLSNSVPEVDIAIVRISPQSYLSELDAGAAARRKAQETLLTNWKAASSLALGLGEIAVLPDSTTDKAQLAEQAQDILRAMLDYRNSGITINILVAVHSEYAIPDVMRALAAFKPKDLDKLLIAHLEETDVIVRATAAELLGNFPGNESISTALIKALPRGLRDSQNDAALAILDSLAKKKTPAAYEAIKSALDSSDYLVRRHAVGLLKANGVGDLSSRIGIVQARNTLADYHRAISRMGRQVRAIVSTSSGKFTIELLPDDAPLTVDNFVQLAKRGYFRGVTFHRVVPNFVIQGGDPRGDGNGGPGYQIRCEINQAPYERGAVGMALSGKDTGGSQWFVTHSPQPHLDGGYTVFGRVVDGMNVVDGITRGETINTIVIINNGGVERP